MEGLDRSLWLLIFLLFDGKFCIPVLVFVSCRINHLFSPKKKPRWQPSLRHSEFISREMDGSAVFICISAFLFSSLLLFSSPLISPIHP